MKLRLLSLLILLSALFCPCAMAEGPDDGDQAQTLLSARVAYVVEQGPIEGVEPEQLWQRLEVIITSGARRGEVITVETTRFPSARPTVYREGDRLFVSESEGADGEPVLLIVGRDRSAPLVALAILFVLLVLAIGRRQGIGALLGLALSFGIVFWFLVPAMAEGTSPIRAVLLGLAVAMPISFYLSHGLNLKSTIALLASWLGLLVTWGLANLAVQLVHLSGLAADEAMFLQALRPGDYDFSALLVAGMLISMMGVLDDVTVAQAAVIEQLRLGDPSLGWRELFARAMHVGRDHIASMVNTLVLVYAGASLPLLLLLTDRSLPLGYVLSQQIVAEEIVRMLVTSAGLLAVVPICTLLAALVFGRRPRVVEPTPNGGNPS